MFFFCTYVEVFYSDDPEFLHQVNIKNIRKAEQKRWNNHIPPGKVDG